MSESESPCVYTFLDRVRKRPTMYLRRRNRGDGLLELELIVQGYYSGLRNHGIIEDCPQLTQSHFLSWLRLKRWSEPTGWGRAINQHCPADRDPLDVFFELVDEYRSLAFDRRMEVQLGEHHNPTRARCKIGIDKKMEKPLHVTLCSYDPAEMYFFLFKYPKRTSVGHILFDNGNVQSSLGYAKKWALDELQIQEHEWNER